MDDSRIVVIEAHVEHLLVDDQKSFWKQFKLAAKILRIKNYELFQTSDEMLPALPPDPNNVNTIFCDWNLVGSSKMYGPLVKELSEKMPNAKIYVVSTSEDEQEISEAKSNGAHGWIVKTNLIPVLKKWQKEKDKERSFKVWK